MLRSSLAFFWVDRPQLSVITGRGNHSHGGVARIRPAVIDYLTNRHYRYTHIDTQVKTHVRRVHLHPPSSSISVGSLNQSQVLCWCLWSEKNLFIGTKAAMEDDSFLLRHFYNPAIQKLLQYLYRSIILWASVCLTYNLICYVCNKSFQLRVFLVHLVLFYICGMHCEMYFIQSRNIFIFYI